ncbi:hypothetical protein D3C76_891890 [compost metagenome]
MGSLVHQHSDNAKLGTDISGKFLRLHRQLLHLICHYRKSTSMLSGMRRFNRSVHRQQAALIRKLPNLSDQGCNLFGLMLKI